MKRAYLIAGPESAGNKITTRLFCMAGCAGTWQEPQELNHFIAGREHDITNIIGQAQQLAYIQSIPGGPIYRPHLPAIKRKFESAGFQTLTILILRDWYCNVKSKLLWGHQTQENLAWNELALEWIHIGQSLLHLRPFYIISSSSMFLAPHRAIFGLEQFTGLKFPQDVYSVITDADAKYYPPPPPPP